MKKVLKSGKFIIMLGMVLLFAGCMTAPSEDNPVSASKMSDNYVGTWKGTVDVANATLSLEPSSLTGAAYTLNGHSVEIMNDTQCSWDGGNGQLNCNIKIKNLDTNEGLWDIKARLHDPTGSGTAAIMNAADYILSDVGAVTSLVPNTPVPIDGAGYCTTEAGKNGVSLEGCGTFTRDVLTMVEMYVHPRCGTITKSWQFDAVDSGTYNFYVDIFGDFYPENPFVSPDSRWNGTLMNDFANTDTVNVVGANDYLTYVVNVNQLNTNYAAVGEGYISCAAFPCVYRSNYAYRVGSTYYQDANGKYVGKSNSIADPILPTGRYFAVEVLYEYPDRMENYADIGEDGAGTVCGAAGGIDCYEYYNNFAFALYWDEAVLKKVDRTTMKTGAGTILYGGVVSRCGKWKMSKTGAEKNNCNIGWMGHHPLASYDTNVTRSNFISTSAMINAFAAAGSTYFFPSPAATNIPKTATVWVESADAGNRGHKGVAHFGLSPSPTYNDIVNDGADARPDFSVGLFYMYVVGASGTGSEIAITNTSKDTPTMKWTNGTVATGDDINHKVYSLCTEVGRDGACTVAYCQTHTECAVEGGNQKSNPLLPGGYANSHAHPQALGGHQFKNAHVCVQ